jgi:polar amino acid transport system permease protein
MSDFLDAFFDFDILRQARTLLLDGLLTTLLLSAIALPLGLSTGLALALLSRISPLAARLTGLFVDFFRSVPPLVLLILLFAGLPFAGLNLGPWTSVAICFLLNAGVYYCEVFRTGLDAVPAGQSDAARALGLRPTYIMALVLLPQAVRKVLPDLVSNSLEVVKLTSIAYVVAIPELLYRARQAQSTTYNATPIVAAVVIYFVLLWPVVRWLSHLENARLQQRQ